MRKKETDDIRFLRIAELGAPDLDIRVAPSCLSPNFGAYMLTFSVTICPDEQRSGESGLLLDIFGDALLLL
jgi:hypothetical protein